MTWELNLIKLFCYICKQCEYSLLSYCERFSNNNKPEFTDEEVITIYIWGIIQGNNNLTQIHCYTKNHLSGWFPKLPRYEAYVQRLNRIESVFVPLINSIQGDLPTDLEGYKVMLMDSMPIIIAQSRRSGSAKTANIFADKGYCSSKRMYYYGVKLHILGVKRNNTLPIPDYIGLSPASNHDLNILKDISEDIYDVQIYTDKGYFDEVFRKQIKEDQGVELFMPVKRKKGQKELSLFQKILSTNISKIRQPIESLFNWIHQKTGIQNASKVRSFKGLITHIFGRMAAAMLLFLNIFNS